MSVARLSSNNDICNMKIQEKFGLVLKELRTHKKISQEQLALNADIDRTYVGDIEKGNRNISIVTIEKLANYFQISISELFKLVEDYGKIK